MLALRDLLLGERGAASPAALAGNLPRSWAAFRRDAGRVAALAPGATGGRWLLACEEAWDFAAGLAGLLQAGRTVVVPPNFLPATLARLAIGADGVLRALPEAGPVRAPGPLTGTVEFQTAGTTGEPKAVTKDVPRLDAEVAMLEACFGGPLGPAPVAATVPHQHIYGCLFRILWPLAAGRPFLLEACGDPGSFRAALALAPVLVSSPAHLARLPELMDLRTLPHQPVAVFSSGGPLGRAEALAWRQWLPAGVVEVYGSTESGGIAWRRQGEAPGSELWTPLPDCELAQDDDGALVVRSFRAGPAPLRMEDAAAFTPEGTFRLLGRLDRTVKLEGKRVSLPELETALAAHPWVARAAVILLEGPRPALGAAVVLKPGPARSRAELVAALRGHLAGQFEPVGLPRRWRFPEALPEDGRGKLTAQALAALFRRPGARR